MEDSQQRWHMLYESGCRTGQELRLAWETVQSEALALSEYLGRDLDFPLAA